MYDKLSSSSTKHTVHNSHTRKQRNTDIFANEVESYK